MFFSRLRHRSWAFVGVVAFLSLVAVVTTISSQTGGGEVGKVPGNKEPPNLVAGRRMP